MVLQHGEQYSYDQRETRQEVEHCAHKIKHLDILNRGHVNEGQIQQVAQRKGAQKSSSKSAQAYRRRDTRRYGIGPAEQKIATGYQAEHYDARIEHQIDHIAPIMLNVHRLTNQNLGTKITLSGETAKLILRNFAFEDGSSIFIVYCKEGCTHNR